jgi:uncharacterized protein (DUF2147 family)
MALPIASAAAAVLAPSSAAAKPPRDPVVTPGTRFYKATICADGKVYPGGKPNTAGCRRGFTTVSGRIKYDGMRADLLKGDKVNCFANSNGPRNTASWCGSVNEGAGPPDFFMSLGANGQFETDSQRSFSSSVNVESNGKIYKGGGSVSAGNTTDSVKIQAYWIRIDVRANGSYELRGGLNG